MSARSHLIAALAGGRRGIADLADVAHAEQLVDAHRAEVLADAAAAPLTVYRASYDAEEMGLFATRQAARAQCEAHERNDWLTATAPAFTWVPDDPEDDLSPEELWTSITADAEGSETGYVVTPLLVPAEYTPHTDE